MTAQDWTDYEILGSGGGEKLERWKDVYLLRPDPQAIWSPEFDLKSYKKLNARYIRSKTGGGAWERLRPMPEQWQVEWKELTFLVKPMGFKHTGLFPEQAVNWQLMQDMIKGAGREINVLNLFGYTGGATVACASAGAKVTHVDAAKAMVDRCRQNANLSGVAGDRIRYIVDDCAKFVSREIKRGKTYDAVIMDPPSYGRGASGEVWRMEDDVYSLVELCAQVLTDPQFFLINSYTTGLQPQTIANILELTMPRGQTEAYEVCLPTERKIALPCGCSGLWRCV